LGNASISRIAGRVDGFPAWATLPGSEWLAMGRRWHFFFAWLFVANGIVYALLAILGGHLLRDLAPSRQDLRQIGHSIRQHMRLRFPKGPEARRYNVLQNLSYLSGLCLLCPLIILAGLAMSPQLDAGYPGCSGSSTAASRRAPSLRLCASRSGLCRGSPADGPGLGRLEQHPVDDHRLV
jgi:thiosulfate reductase cytochrome b subunit